MAGAIRFQQGGNVGIVGQQLDIDVGVPFTMTDVNGSPAPRLWSFSDVPDGPASDRKSSIPLGPSAISNSATITGTATLDVVGTYLISYEAAGVIVDLTVRAVNRRGWAKPAFGSSEAAVFRGGRNRAHAAELDAIIDDYEKSIEAAEVDPFDRLIYIDGVAGDDTANDGLSAGKPIKTIEKAVAIWRREWSLKHRLIFLDDSVDYTLTDASALWVVGRPVGVSSEPLVFVGKFQTLASGSITSVTAATETSGPVFNDTVSTFSVGALHGQLRMTSGPNIGKCYNVQSNTAHGIEVPGLLGGEAAGQTFVVEKPTLRIKYQSVSLVALNGSSKLGYSLGFRGIVFVSLGGSFQIDTSLSAVFETCEFDFGAGLGSLIVSKGASFSASWLGLPDLSAAGLQGCYIHDGNTTQAIYCSSSGQITLSNSLIKSAGIFLDQAGMLAFSCRFKTGSINVQTQSRAQIFGATYFDAYPIGVGGSGGGVLEVNAGVDISNAPGDAISATTGRIVLNTVTGSGNVGRGMSLSNGAIAIVNAGTTLTGNAGNLQADGRTFGLAAMRAAKGFRFDGTGTAVLPSTGADGIAVLAAKTDTELGNVIAASGGHPGAGMMVHGSTATAGLRECANGSSFSAITGGGGGPTGLDRVLSQEAGYSAADIGPALQTAIQALELSGQPGGSVFVDPVEVTLASAVSATIHEAQKVRVYGIKGKTRIKVNITANPTTTDCITIGHSGGAGGRFEMDNLMFLAPADEVITCRRILRIDSSGNGYVALHDIDVIGVYSQGGMFYLEDGTCLIENIVLGGHCAVSSSSQGIFQLHEVYSVLARTLRSYNTMDIEGTHFIGAGSYALLHWNPPQLNFSPEIPVGHFECDDLYTESNHQFPVMLGDLNANRGSTAVIRNSKLSRGGSGTSNIFARKLKKLLIEDVYTNTSGATAVKAVEIYDTVDSLVRQLDTNFAGDPATGGGGSNPAFQTTACAIAFMDTLSKHAEIVECELGAITGAPCGVLLPDDHSVKVYLTKSGVRQRVRKASATVLAGQLGKGSATDGRVDVVGTGDDGRLTTGVLQHAGSSGDCVGVAEVQGQETTFLSDGNTALVVGDLLTRSTSSAGRVRKTTTGGDKIVGKVREAQASTSADSPVVASFELGTV